MLQTGCSVTKPPPELLNVQMRLDLAGMPSTVLTGAARSTLSGCSQFSAVLRQCASAVVSMSRGVAMERTVMQLRQAWCLPVSRRTPACPQVPSERRSMQHKSARRSGNRPARTQAAANAAAAVATAAAAEQAAEAAPPVLPFCPDRRVSERYIQRLTHGQAVGQGCDAGSCQCATHPAYRLPMAQPSYQTQAQAAPPLPQLAGLWPAVRWGCAAAQPGCSA